MQCEPRRGVSVTGWPHVNSRDTGAIRHQHAPNASSSYQSIHGPKFQRNGPSAWLACAGTVPSPWASHRDATSGCREKQATTIRCAAWKPCVLIWQHRWPLFLFLIGHTPGVPSPELAVLASPPRLSG